MEQLQPELRFPEFKDGWLSKKLSEVSIIGRGKSKHRPRDAGHLYDGAYPFIQTGDIRNAGLYLTNYTQTYSEAGLNQSKLWDENTLCITIAANIAETTILKIKACFPDSIIGLIPNEKDSLVLFIKYQFDKFKIEIQNLSQGVAQANLNQEKLSNIVFNFPSLFEQTKIAAFLSAVDEKLNLLNEKKSALEEYKKGMMQKIFSQEIRFKDKNGKDFAKWVKVVLKDVFDYKKGSGLSKDKLDFKGKHGCILYGELYTKYNEVIFNVISKTNSNEGLQSIKGDLLIPSSTTTSGIDLANVTALNYDNVLLGGDITVLRSNQKVSSIFYAYYLSNHKKEEIASYAQGITIVHLYYNHIKDMIIDFPCFEEQTKIASFLSAIDEKIELVSIQINETQEYKNGLLQKMFV